MLIKTGVTLRAERPILPDGITIEQTQWVISTDKSLTDESKFVKNVTNDNLYSHRFVLDMDDSIEYWGSFRFVLNNGFTEFAEPMKIIPNEAAENLLNIDTPSLVAPVVLTTGFDPSYHPNSMFMVRGSEFNVIGEATHKSTTWIIEDEKGEVLFIRENDEENLTSLLVDHKLPSGIVKIKAIYHGTNNDSSQISTKIINVSDGRKIRFLEDGIIMQADYSITVNMRYDNGVDNIIVKHYVDDVLNTEFTSDTFSFSISKDDNIIVGRHIIEIKTVALDGEISEPRFIGFEVQQLEDDSYVVIIPNVYGGDNKISVDLEKFGTGNNGFDYTFPVIFS